jgi:ferredoxin-like protein FixX
MAKKLSQGKREPITFNLSNLLYRSKKDTGDFLFLDAEKCNGCGDCVNICAVGIWSVPGGKKAKISPRYRELCLECAGCWQMCDQEAIQFSFPKGGSGVVIKWG